MKVMTETSSGESPRHGKGRLLAGFSQSVMLRVARLVIHVGVTSYLARHLGKEGLGVLGASMALVSVLSAAAELGMGRVVARHLLEPGQDERVVLGSSFYTRLAAGVLLMVLLGLYVLIWRPGHAMILMLYGIVLVFHAFTDLVAWFEAKGRMLEVARMQFAGFALSVAAIVAGIWTASPLEWFALTYVIECLATVAALLTAYQHGGGSLPAWKWDAVMAMRLLSQSWYEMASQLAMLMLLRMDAVMLQMLRGDAEAGIYTAAVRISEAAYFLPLTLSGFMLAPLAASRRAGVPEYHGKLARYLAANLSMACGVAVFITLAAPLAVGLLFGDGFAAAADVLRVHAWALLPYALGVARTQYLTLEGRLDANLPAVLLALTANMALNWLWIPAHGAAGAAWATLASYTLAWMVTTPCIPVTRGLVPLLWRGLLGLPALLREMTGRPALRIHFL